MRIRSFSLLLMLIHLASCFVSSTSTGGYYLQTGELERLYPIEDNQPSVVITDERLKSIANKMRANWSVTETASYILFESNEPVRISLYPEGQFYEFYQDTGYSTTLKLKLTKFDITDTVKLVSSIHKLDSLNKIIQMNPTCVYDPCYQAPISFVHFNTLWRQNMYDKGQTRRDNRERKPCQDFDNNYVQREYDYLKKSIPTYFSNGLALGNMMTNWTFCAANTQVIIEPEGMSTEIANVLDLLNSTFETFP